MVIVRAQCVLLRTAKHALSTVEKRLDTHQADLDLVKREGSEIQQRRRVAAGEVGPEVGQCHDYTPPDAPVGTTVRRDEDGYFDIREPLDELEPGDEVRDLEHREVEQQQQHGNPTNQQVNRNRTAPTTIVAGTCSVRKASAENVYAQLVKRHDPDSNSVLIAGNTCLCHFHVCLCDVFFTFYSWCCVIAVQDR